MEKRFEMMYSLLILNLKFIQDCKEIFVKVCGMGNFELEKDTPRAGNAVPGEYPWLVSIRMMS